LPDAVVFALKQTGEFFNALETVFFFAHALGTAEVIGIFNELRALAKMAVAPAVAIAGSDRRGAQRPAVIAAFKGEHQAFSPRVIAHQFERVLDRLGTAAVEMNAALQAELTLGVLGDARGELDFFPVQILRSHLRQSIELAVSGIVQSPIAVT